MSYTRANRSRTVRALVLAAGAALIFSSVVNADPTASDPSNPTSPATTNPLSGPQVNNLRAPGATGNFGVNETGKGAALGHLKEGPIFRKALQEALGPEAPADIQATPDQKTKIEAILQQHGQEVRAYMAAHEAEIKQLRQEARPAARNANSTSSTTTNTPSTNSTTTTNAQNAQAAREKLKEIMQAAPQPEAMMNLVWQVLTPAQKTAVQARMELLNKEESKLRAERAADARLNRQTGNTTATTDGTTTPPVTPRRRRPPQNPDSPATPAPTSTTPTTD